MRMMDCLELREKEMVCFVGGGGKSSLILSLAEEYARAGKRVLVTTTTKMYSYQMQLNAELVLEQELTILLEKIKKIRPAAAAGSSIVKNNKVQGLDPEVINYIYQKNIFDCILVEADGSRGKSLKAPAEYEPVLPSLCTTVIPVAGIDVLNYPLNEIYVHRPHLVQQITKQGPGCLITAKTFHNVILHYLKIAGSKCLKSRVIPVINKADNIQLTADAEDIARGLLMSNRIKKVLITSFSYPGVVREVVM